MQADGARQHVAHGRRSRRDGNYYAYALYASTGTGVPSGNGLVGHDRRETSARPPRSRSERWTHLAATYDGTMLRLFVNGVQVRAALHGRLDRHLDRRAADRRQQHLGRVVQGLIDEVRIYNRALTAAQIQADMAASISNPDPCRRRRPATLDRDRSIELGRASAGPRRRTTSASSRYNVYRSADPGFTPSARTASRSRRARATPTPASPPAPTTTASRPRMPPATSGRRRPRHRRRPPVTSRRRPHRGTLDRDVQAPAARRLAWGAANDNVAVARYNVHRSTTSGFTPSAANRIAQPTARQLQRHGPRRRHLLLPGDRRGCRRQRRRRLESGERHGHRRRHRAGLVAAYGFDEARARRPTDHSGTATTARSRRDVDGEPASSAARSRSTASNDIVNVPDSQLARSHDRDDARGLGPADGARNGWRTVDRSRSRRATTSTALYAQHRHEPAAVAGDHRRRRPLTCAATAVVLH